MVPRILVVLLSLVVLSGCVSLDRETWFVSSFTQLPGTRPEMNTPGYWIGRLAQPDTLLFSREDLAQFQQAILKTGTVRDLILWTPPATDALRKELLENIKWISSGVRYVRSGQKAETDFFAPFAANCSPETVLDPVVPRWGFLTKKADLRVLPTELGLYDAPGDYFSDNFQVSSLEWGTPLAVTHTSADGLWYYVTTQIASGWIKADQVVFSPRDVFERRLAAPQMVTLVGAKTDLWGDPSKTQYRGTLRMGARGPAAPDPQPGVLGILMPVRGEGGEFQEQTFWIDQNDGSLTPLPFTQRTILTQAFKFLNAPYGWGGMFGEQDCSQFLWEVYATVGLILPRNSFAQGKTGVPMSGFGPSLPDGDKEGLILTQGIPGATLLRLPGHIVLYLGQVDGKAYAIHSTWAIREARDGADTVRLINRTVVTDLHLGEGSQKGSLLARLSHAALLKPLLVESAPVGSP